MTSSRKVASSILYAENNSDISVNSTTRIALPGLSLTLAANCVYDIYVLVPFTSVISTNTLRIATLAWPTGATAQFEAVVWNSASSGTAPKTNQFWATSATAVSGTSGSSSVVGSTMLASVVGRIKMGSTPGDLAMAIAAFATTGNVTVAANAASMVARKVSGAS